MKKLFGAIEAGGTKFNCMVATDPNHITEEIRIPTTNPTETIEKAAAFFRPYLASGELTAVGIASFGPVDLNISSPTYGYITITPKPGWGMTNIYGQVQQALGIPAAFDTDVNAAAFGEYSWVEANHQLDPFVYITVGTGIGVGVLINGSLLHGLLHGEAGHLRIPHDLSRDPFEGMCPFHKDCLEGLASGPAMQKRWGASAETLPDDHPAWQLEAEYLAYGIANLIFTLSPRRIVLGGGVMHQPGLLQKVRQQVFHILNGYIHVPEILEQMDNYIVSPSLGNRSGMLGAIALAKLLVE
jgi:fructokinase